MTSLEQAARALLESLEEWPHYSLDVKNAEKRLRAALAAESGRVSGSSTDLELEALMRRTGTEGYPSDVRRLVEAVRNATLEEAKAACVAWGNEKVRKWSASGDDAMIEDAKARAWDALQCAAAIDALRSKP